MVFSKRVKNSQKEDTLCPLLRPAQSFSPQALSGLPQAKTSVKEDCPSPWDFQALLRTKVLHFSHFSPCPSLCMQDWGGILSLPTPKKEKRELLYLGAPPPPAIEPRRLHYHSCPQKACQIRSYNRSQTTSGASTFATLGSMAQSQPPAVF